MSKRHLRRFVEEGVVAGWDDPRMPTLAAIAPPRLQRRRRQGFPWPRGRGQGRFHGGPRPARALRARRSGRPRPARHGRAPSYQGDACQLARGLCGRDHHGEPPRPSRDGRAHAAHGQCALHRPRGLHGRAAQEVLPPRSRPRSAPQGRLHHPLRGSRPRCKRRSRRAYMLRGHGQPLRQRGCQPQGQGHAALAERAGRPPLRDAPLRAHPP